MKKLIDKRIVYVNAALLVLGIVAGILFLVFTSKIDKIIVKNEISDFFDLISNGSANFSNLFSSFRHNILYVFIITVASIIYLFSPLILFINFYRGVLLGFLVSSVIMTFKLKGILYGILIVFPHHLLMAVFLIFYSSLMLHFSFKLFRGTYKNESINLNTFIKKIGVIFGFGALSCLFISILEIYVSPIFIKLFI